MRKKIIRVFMILVLIIGALIIGYPSFANWWNQQQQNGAIVRYTRMIEAMEPEEVTRMREDARRYNATHPVSPAKELEGRELAEYNSVLDVSGTGIMGYVEIPKIGVNLPMYHTTSEAVLQVAVGHLEGTSLPVGGPGTHCVLSGHTGLPNAELFTRLDELEEGDRFSLQVLGENLLYEVDQIEIVLPSVLDSLAAEEGEDYCTLFTCTPYGINSHRLLVRGRRVIVEEEPEIEDPAEAAARASLIQQMRASDLRYMRVTFMDGIFVNFPVFAIFGLIACVINFLVRLFRRLNPEDEEPEKPEEKAPLRDWHVQLPRGTGNPDDWWNGGGAEKDAEEGSGEGAGEDSGEGSGEGTGKDSGEGSGESFGETSNVGPKAPGSSGKK